ncbi:MAG: T9SS type A sorting domain-containing protein [Bacteroidia bacterium]
MKKIFLFGLLFSATFLSAQVDLVTGLIGRITYYAGGYNDIAGVGMLSNAPLGSITSVDECGVSPYARFFSGLSTTKHKINDNGLMYFGSTSSFSFVSSFKTAASATSELFTNRAYSNYSSGWSIGLDNSQVGCLFVTIGDNANPVWFRTVNTFNDNQWHQNVLVVDRITNRIRLYIDDILQPLVNLGPLGTLVGNEIDISSVVYNANPVATNNNFIGNHFNGNIDEVRFYNIPLDSIKVHALDSLRKRAPTPIITGGPTSSYTNQTQLYYTSNTANATYGWIFSGGTGSSTTFSIPITWTVPGSHDVRVYYNLPNGCFSDTSGPLTVQVFQNTAAVKELPGAGKISFYPNPSTDFLMLESENPVSDVWLRIFDSNGKLVSESKSDLYGQTKIDISTLPKGSYTLLLENEKGQTHLRFVHN